MSTLIMVRVPYGFTPASDMDREILEESHVGLGEQCKVVFTKPRNLKFLAKYMVMISETFHMQDSFDNIHHWRDAVQIAAGHCETFITHEGKVNYKPKSVSFAKCDETEFSQVYKNALQAICTHWVNSEADELAVILEFM